jgi:tRNA dimethylallyltransferase
MTSWFKNTKKVFKKDNFIKIYIDFPRPELIQRINKRTQKMLDQGAINEVRRFSKLNIKKDNSTTKIIGIQEILKFLQGESSLSEVKEQISIKTRQYAKRQNTWARGQMIDWQKIEPQNLKLMLKKF